MSPAAYWTIAGIVAAAALIFIFIHHKPSQYPLTVEDEFRRNTNIDVGAVFLAGADVWPLLGVVCVGVCIIRFLGMVKDAWHGLPKG